MAVAMVFGLVAVNIPGFVTETAAAGTVTEELPSYHVMNRTYKDGLYIIRSAANEDMVLDIGTNTENVAGINSVLDKASDDRTQRFVIQIDQNLYAGELGCYYGIRSIPSSYWLGVSSASQGANVQQLLSQYRADTGRWQFIDNGDGTVYIVLASTVTINSDGSTDLSGAKYLYTSGTDAGAPILLGTLDSSNISCYQWKLEQTHMQDSFFATGTYWLETRLKDSDGVQVPNETNLSAPVNTVTISDSNAIISQYVPASVNEPNSSGIVAEDPNRANYERQQFVIQKISSGFYSIVNVSTGCYLAVDANGNVINGSLSSGAPSAAERWIIYPGTFAGNTNTSNPDTGTVTGSVNKFRIISALTGRQLTVQSTNEGKTALASDTSALAVSRMENAAVQDWLLKDVRFDPNNVAKGDTQTINTGVYADTFDTTDTVTLPIKIFDYAADGMLFEYAANTADEEFHYQYMGTGGNCKLNESGGYDVVTDGSGDYMRYRLGNNLGFGMVSRSDGGTLGKDWKPGNFFGNYEAYGSNSFGYNKYWCPYISELRLNNSDGSSYTRVINDYVYNGDGEGYKPMVLISAGTMNTSDAGVDYSDSADVAAALGYAMYGEQTFGNATMGLLESGLKTVVVSGKTYTLPRYRQETVEYIAMLLQRSLEIKYASTEDPAINYNYVDGETSFADLASGMDLAALLRGDTKADTSNTGVLEYEDGTKLTTNFTKIGDYSDTSAKSAQLIGTWADVKDDIKTCMDAAYWMLNSIFLENSYNQPQDRYNSLVLTKVTDQDGKSGYIFDSTFINSSSSEAGGCAVAYDSAMGTIRNTSAAGKSYTYWKTNASAATYAFTPVRADYVDANGNVINGDGTAENPKGYQDQTDTPYFLDGGITKSDVGDADPEYKDTNFNFVLQSNAYFIYHPDDQLFFEFEGDDDVYLFINGQLVLDIGGAHAVTGTKMQLNDYVTWAWSIKNDAEAYAQLTDTEKQRVDALALEEGNTYSFDFYYMERHGYGSNMRIFTNFQLASGQIEAEKSAKQNGTDLSYGSVIDESKNVEYTFTLKNGGTANLIMPTFSDSDIGVTISYETGLTVADGTNGVVVFDKNGDALDFSDLVFTYQLMNSQGVVQSSVVKTFTNEADMIKYLTHELVIDRCDEENETYGVLTVGGIYYHLTNDQIKEGAFHNEVEVSAYVRNDGQSLLAGQTAKDGTPGPVNVPTGSVLYDSAQFSVYLLSRPLYYHWCNHKLEITVADLLAEVQPASRDQDNPLSNLVHPTITGITKVTLTDEKGVADTTNQFVFVDSSSYSVYANYDTTGIKLIHLTIEYNYTTTNEEGETVSATATATIPVQIFVLDVQSYTYVLDYGLRVELTYKELFDEDTYTVAGRETVFEILGITNEDNVPSYGNNSVNGFNKLTGNGNPAWGILAGDTDYQGNININAAGTATDYVEIDPVNSETNIFMTYTPKEFMDQRDTVYIAFRVREASYTGTAVLGDTGNTDIRNEAVMFKEVTFLPANVVYYEDDFAGVTYKTDKDTFTPTSEHGQAQSSDQNEQYGHDHVYAGSTDVTMSGGIITTITLGENQDKTLEAATFTFNGTGFEMISRTNAADSAIIQVMVTGVFEAGGTSTTKYYPIITEFDQVTTTGTDQTAETDEVYQVPVFRLTDLPYGEFTVTISGIPTYEFDADFNPHIKPTKLYIDGIRIYNPLEDPAASEYGDELGAQFTELRTLVFDSKAAAIGLTYQENTTDTPVLSGTFGQHGSFTENLNKGWFEDTSGNLQQFAIAGPNNEVYMDAAGGNAVVLFVKETAANTQGLLHIGVHDLDESDFAGGTGTNGASAIRYWTEDGWVNITVGTSGTEQYYPIDYRSCPKVDENSDYYYVVIQVDSGMVSFTNVKTVGLEFGKLEKTTENVRYKYENGVLLQAPMNEDTWTEVSCPLVTQLLSLKSVLRSTTNAGQPDEEQPGGDHTGSDESIEENPDTGDIDLLWAVALIGLLGLAAIVPMIRKEVRA